MEKPNISRLISGGKKYHLRNISSSDFSYHRKYSETTLPTQYGRNFIKGDVFIMLDSEKGCKEDCMNCLFKEVTAVKRLNGKVSYKQGTNRVLVLKKYAGERLSEIISDCKLPF